MTLYADAETRPDATIDALHADELRSFARPGTWGTAAQRTAIAATARAALCEAGLQAPVRGEVPDAAVSLPPPATRLARDVALGASGIDRAYCGQAQSDGLTEGAYVEIVGVASRLANLDVFARGIGVAPRPLQDPVDDAKPSFERPAEARDEGFFTATVPNYPDGGALAESLYGRHYAGNILRSLSLVPGEARRVITLVGQQYFSGEKLMDFSPAPERPLSRAQIELVATKVSAHNQCFY